MIKSIVTFILILNSFLLFGQNHDTSSYVNAFRYCKLHNYCDTNVLVVKINKNYNDETTFKRWEVSEYFFKTYYKKKTYFKIDSIANYGDVIIIKQYNSWDKPLRTFTLFLKYEIKLITVIEIEEIKK